MPPYTKTNWKDRVVENQRTYNVQNNPDGTITLFPAPGTVHEEGTKAVAALMNKMEQGIADALPKDGSQAMTGDLTIGKGAGSIEIIDFSANQKFIRLKDATNALGVGIQITNGVLDLYDNANGPIRAKGNDIITSSSLSDYNLNLIATTGVYYVMSGSGLPGGAAQGYLFHHQSPDISYAKQTIMSPDGDIEYHRVKYSGVWREWRPVGNVQVGRPRTTSASLTNSNWFTLVDVSGVSGRLERATTGAGSGGTVSVRVTIDGNSDVYTATATPGQPAEYLSSRYGGEGSYGIQPSTEPIYFYNSLKVEAMASSGNGTSEAVYRLKTGTP